MRKQWIPGPSLSRPFHPRAGDVIHPVLWLVKGRAIARLIALVAVASGPVASGPSSFFKKSILIAL